MINTYKNKKFNYATDYERSCIVLSIECRFGEKIGKAHDDLKNEGDNYAKNLETLYDEKFKENTKRQKGKYSQLKYLEKKVNRMHISWKKEDSSNNISKTGKKYKCDTLPDFKQNKIQNIRKSSRQNSRQKVLSFSSSK